MQRSMERIEELECYLLQKKDEEIKNLKQKMEIERFGVQRFSNDDSMIQLYTGFGWMAMFSAFF